MKISDYVANYILELLEENEDESVEIKRNELANTIGCVPSQINYVITSRFTPEQGYLVESQRGGGGYRGYPGCSNSKIYPSFFITKASGADQYFKSNGSSRIKPSLCCCTARKTRSIKSIRV